MRKLFDFLPAQGVQQGSEQPHSCCGRSALSGRVKAKAGTPRQAVDMSKAAWPTTHPAPCCLADSALAHAQRVRPSALLGRFVLVHDHDIRVARVPGVLIATCLAALATPPLGALVHSRRPLGCSLGYEIVQRHVQLCIDLHLACAVKFVRSRPWGLRGFQESSKTGSQREATHVGPSPVMEQFLIIASHPSVTITGL